MLNGWKSTIGLFLLYLESKMDFPDYWYVHVTVGLIYIWTGVGLFHKITKTDKGKEIVNATRTKVLELRKRYD